MRTVSLKVMHESMELSYSEKDNQPPFRKFMIAYDKKQKIGENLEKIKIALAGLSFDAGIIEDPLIYNFSDTIVGINHQQIDMGLALTNMLNIPVVSEQAVNTSGLAEAVSQKKKYNEWHLDYFGQYNGKRNYGQEAMLTIGNGYLGLRGAYVEANADSNNYPGMYVAGVYNQLTTNINGRQVTNEDLVNLPNAQYLSFGVDHQNPFKIDKDDIQEIYRSLDLKNGQLSTSMLIQLSTGHLLEIKTTKVADMVNWHRFSIKYDITPVNFTGSLQVYSKIDAAVINGNVERYQDFDQHHIDVTSMSSQDNVVLLAGQTKQSKIQFCVGSTLSLSESTDKLKIQTTNDKQQILQVASVQVTAGQSFSFEKTVAVHTSLETKGDLAAATTADLPHQLFDAISKDTTTYWTDTWKKIDIQIENDISSQKLTRVNLYHLMISGAAKESGKLDASIGARGLHGEAYRGHIFWDEMFFMPFYALHYPKIAKSLLMYRYNRLDAARDYAKSESHEGAMYPWQSGLKGDEQSQFVHLNPVTHQWDPDNSRLQRHVSIAIAYNVLYYVNITGDTTFMNQYGLEMLLSIAKFWISMSHYDSKEKRYNISGVMGPDEFHENYPNSDKPGLTNNAYTNIMVAWLFDQILEIAPKIDKKILTTVENKSKFSHEDLVKMTDISSKLKLSINSSGIIAQFENYFKLPRLDFDAYRRKYGDISRMDRLLKSEGKSPDAYQVAKQADALMAYHLISPKSVEAVIQKLGYKLPNGYLTRNIQYYLDRTTHGSTLSRIVYAVLTAMDQNMDQSWKFFSTALFSDYYDIQGGTTAEGIHLGVMGATILIETRDYGGVHYENNQLSVSPKLPDEWTTIHFKEAFRGNWFDFSISHHLVTVKSEKPAIITVCGKKVNLEANKQEKTTY
ncbi:glycoside hydrolase family 65 protein [Secundilactobacillus malefermentans]|uniref:Glycoside hydrolase family 65 central catalytic domain-containing protein n=1 Tax=Secundilactobacillus malefermentans TaxID=176292 RepID=A0A4R5NQK3_9LACO|nr:glycosyl hydrolase family 65 protein [Secundilactobacillus malefermentans]KRM55670.1 Trehalose 6-phosphate phosphorylase [Secundilactobacillus malefermentans DSM 5705 = KCTC 3548]QEA30784.1 glycoside hydrolase family 65 protein [Secundilactobacillus malefermentans]TDG78575.1 hypothetical protein C5L31_001586 [Secundilactobacillus malefermentans]